MIIKEEDIRQSNVLEVAKKLMIAARTAPKACGVDNLLIAIADKEDIIHISNRLKEIYDQKKEDFLLRDSQNVLSAECVVMIGCKNLALGLDCGYCGFATCASKAKNIPCFFAVHDLGLAIGSAVGVAADNRLDTRIMFSLGLAIKSLGYLGTDCDYCLAVPLSASGKNPFFDR
jgi:uncharacterized ferredoxin-like protein